VRLCAPKLFNTFPAGVVITPIREEQLKEQLGDSFQELDLPLQVTFPDGTTAALIFLFEFESRPRGDFLHYLGHAVLNVSRTLKTNRVVPVAVHLFEGKPRAHGLRIGSDEEAFLDFHCISVEIDRMNAAEYVTAAISWHVFGCH